MRSLKRIGAVSAAIPLVADDIVEFHAARLLLLMSVCGTSGKIDGLTKMAKLDFFTRYPDFFEVAKRELTSAPSIDRDYASAVSVESAMVRHHYGPWDKRYYHILAYLEANALIEVSKRGKSYQIQLTPLGKERAKALAVRPSFALLVERMREVKGVLGGKSGSALKSLIYKLFDREVSRRPLGEFIR